MNKKKIVLLTAASLILIFSGYVASFQEAKGVVVRIEGNYLSVIDGVGQMVTVNSRDPRDFDGVRVGDKVIIKDGRIFKEIHLASTRTYPNYLNEINLGNVPMHPR